MGWNIELVKKSKLKKKGKWIKKSIKESKWIKKSRLRDNKKWVGKTNALIRRNDISTEKGK
jgi:hypothetical protein